MSLMRMLPIGVLALSLGLAVAAPPTDVERHEAVRRLAEMADSGDAESVYRLAYLHERGYDTIPADSAAARELYLRAAAMGHPAAMSYAGYLLYLDGDSASRSQGLALMGSAAERGDVKAANNLGYLLAYPPEPDVAPDYKGAQYWFGLAAAAGLPTAQAQLADMVSRGLGSEPDTARAEALYVEAAEGGVGDAQLKLLALKAADWKRLPADSMLSLGRYLYTRRAPVPGVALFEMAVEADSLPMALALLGDAYSRAQGVAYDHERSLHYFVEAALKGVPSAQFVVAELLDIFPDALEGRPEIPTGADPAVYTASYWYDLAASSGVTDAATATRRLLEK